MTECRIPTPTYPAHGPVAVCRSSRASTCWMGCRTRSACAWREVWSAAAMLPQQPYTRPAHGTLLPILVTRMLDVLVSIIESVGHA